MHTTLLRAVFGFAMLTGLGTDALTAAEDTGHPTGTTVDSPGYWQPGGYRARIGSPYYYSDPRGPYRSLKRPLTVPVPPAPAPPVPAAPARAFEAPAYPEADPPSVDPYTLHFGPGFYRHWEHGHYRFPYYSYRRPWYFPGPATFNRDTNFAW